MPGGDGTGPRGMGPGAGWGRGGCVPLRRDRGFWRGLGFGSFSAKNEAERIKSERDAIDARLAEISKEK